MSQKRQPTESGSVGFHAAFEAVADGSGFGTHGNDGVGILHHARRTSATLDLVDMLHAGHDLTCNGVLAIEGRRGLEHDEELAVGRVRVHGARHAECAAFELRFARELSLEVGKVAAARAVPVGSPP